MTNTTRPVWYVCAPIRPTEDEVAAAAADGLDPEPRATALEENIQRVERLIAWLRRTWPEVTFIAPWLERMVSCDDSDPVQREAGLIDCQAVVPRCTGVVLIGGRIGDGCRRAWADAGRAVARRVVDLMYIDEPPTSGLVVADWSEAPPARGAFEVAPGYEALADVLRAALDQAAAGKGAERHAIVGEPFADQQICQLGRWLGSTDGELFQVAKKIIESARLPRARAQAELLGAINYAAAAYILRGEGVGEPG